MRGIKDNKKLSARAANEQEVSPGIIIDRDCWGYKMQLFSLPDTEMKERHTINVSVETRAFHVNNIIELGRVLA